MLAKRRRRLAGIRPELAQRLVLPIIDWVGCGIEARTSQVAVSF